jgi:hypothetical protein
MGSAFCVHTRLCASFTGGGTRPCTRHALLERLRCHRRPAQHLSMDYGYWRGLPPRTNVWILETGLPHVALWIGEGLLATSHYSTCMEIGGACHVALQVYSRRNAPCPPPTTQPAVTAMTLPVGQIRGDSSEETIPAVTLPAGQIRGDSFEENRGGPDGGACTAVHSTPS